MAKKFSEEIKRFTGVPVPEGPNVPITSGSTSEELIGKLNQSLAPVTQRIEAGATGTKRFSEEVTNFVFGPEGSRLLRDQPGYVTESDVTRQAEQTGISYDEMLRRMQGRDRTGPQTTKRGGAIVLPPGQEQEEVRLTWRDVGVQGSRLVAEGGLGTLFKLKAAARGVGALGQIGAAGVGEAAGSLALEPFDPSENPLERAAVTGVTGGLIGEGSGQAGTRIYRGATGKNLEPGARAAIAAADAAGAPFLAGEMSKNTTVDFIQNLLEFSLAGRAPIVSAREKMVNVGEDIARGMIGAYRSTDSKALVGQLTKSVIKNRDEVFDAVTMRNYADLDNALFDAGVVDQNLVDVSEAVQAAKVELAQMEKAGSLKRHANRASILQSVIDAGEQEVKLTTNPIMQQSLSGGVGKTIPGRTTTSRVPRKLSWQSAAELRSWLSAVSRDATLNPAEKDLAVRASERLSSMVDSSIERAARDLPPEIKPKWRNTDQFHREGAERLQEEVIRNIALQDSDVAYQIAVKDTHPSNIVRVHEMLVNPPGKQYLTALERAEGERAWQEIQGQYLYDLIQGSTDEISGKVVKNKLVATDPETMRALFPNIDQEILKRNLQTIMLFQGGVGKGAGGSMLAQFETARLATVGLGAVGAVLSGDPTGITGLIGAGTAISMPRLLAKVWASKPFSHWLTIGLKQEPGTRKAIEAASQLSSIVALEAARLRKETEFRNRAKDMAKADPAARITHSTNNAVRGLPLP